MKNFTKKGLALVIGFMVTASFLWAKEKPTTLILHHFLSTSAPPHTDLLVPWAKEVEKFSNGKIKVEIYPSMSMGGKPNELYKQARDGVADIIYTVAGYTPGVFPRVEVYELPTVHTNSSLKTALAIKENFELIKDDFKQVKPLLIAVSGSNQIHTTNKKITKFSDLSGLKLRSPSRTGAWYIEALGARAVGMPIPDVMQSLHKKAIDGAILPMEMFPAYKFQNITQYTTELKDGGGFGVSVLLLLMNKKKFESLPKELQNAIDKASGVELIERFSKFASDSEVFGKKLQIKSKGEVISLNEAESEKFNQAGQQVVKRWVKEMNSKNIDGQKIVDAARKSISKE